MNILKFLILVLILTISNKASAVALNSINCKTAKSEDHTVAISFFRPIDPMHPFIGFLFFSATLSVFKNDVKVYENKSLRMTPEIYTTDINLRGDTDGVHLRLYPQTSTEGEYTHYTGQVFINDLDAKAYFNFKDLGDQPGLYCR